MERDELRADRYAYVLTHDNMLMIGGGSSTKPQVRMYSTFDKAIKIRNQHFPKASIKRVSFSDVGSEMFAPYETNKPNKGE